MPTDNTGRQSRLPPLLERRSQANEMIIALRGHGYADEDIVRMVEPVLRGEQGAVLDEGTSVRQWLEQFPKRKHVSTGQRITRIALYIGLALFLVLLIERLTGILNLGLSHGDLLLAKCAVVGAGFLAAFCGEQVDERWPQALRHYKSND